MSWAEFKTTQITSDVFIGFGGDEFNVGNDKKAILFDIRPAEHHCWPVLLVV